MVHLIWIGVHDDGEKEELNINKYLFTFISVKIFYLN